VDDNLVVTILEASTAVVERFLVESNSELPVRNKTVEHFDGHGGLALVCKALDAVDSFVEVRRQDRTDASSLVRALGNSVDSVDVGLKDVVFASSSLQPLLELGDARFILVTN
jgi:hypothetical protein